MGSFRHRHADLRRADQPATDGGQSGNGLPNATNRPDQVGHVSYPHKVGEWFDTAAFVNPALGAFGNAGHNSLRGPGRDNWNLSLFKSFVFNEARGSRFELRVGKLQHLEPHGVQPGQQRPRLEQLRPGHFCLRSASLPVRGETVLLTTPGWQDASLLARTGNGAGEEFAYLTALRQL